MVALRRSNYLPILKAKRVIFYYYLLLLDTILEGTHPGTIYAKFGSIWPSCFRGEDFFNISQSEKIINLGGHVCWPNGTK
jgi:hypothetical protein